MPIGTDIPIGSPLGGIDTGVDVLQQPATTTRHAVNMRPHDRLAGVSGRLCTRMGSRKWIDSRPCGNNPFQALLAETVKTSGGTTVGSPIWTDSFTRTAIADGELGDFTGDAASDYDSNGSGKCCVGTAMNCAAPGAFYKDVSWNAAWSAGNAVTLNGGNLKDNQANDTSGGAAGRLSAVYFKPTSGGTLPTDNYFIRIKVAVNTLSVTGSEGFVGLFCCGKDSDVVAGTRDKAFVVGVAKTRGVSGGVVSFACFNDSGAVSSPPSGYSGYDWHDPIQIGGGPESYHGPLFAVPASRPSMSWSNSSVHTLELRKTGKRVEFHVDGSLFCAWSDITVRADGAGSTPVNTANTQFGFVLFNVRTNPTGTAAAFDYLDDLEVGAASPQSPTTGVKVVSVVGGSVCVGSKASGFSEASGGSGIYLPTKTVRLINGLGGVTPYAHAIDGTSYKTIDLNLGVVSTWTASPGALPQSPSDPTQKANSGVRHANRIYLYNVPSDPYNFWASRYGNANDWDDNPATPDGYQAVSGDNSDIGLPPFAITCLAPFGADYMVMGGERALAIMAGDPAQPGASIDDLTDKTGICGDLAHARDRAGNLFFMGYGGVWMMPRGTRQIINLTQGKIAQNSDGSENGPWRMRQWLRGIDFSNTVVVLAWDSDDGGLRVCLYTRDMGVSPSYSAFWDQATDSWWYDLDVDAHVPTAVADASDTDGSEYLLLGCRDGYLRQRHRQDVMDDGRTVNAEVWLPTMAVGPRRRCVVMPIAATLGRSGDEAAYQVIASDDPDTLLSSTPSVSGVWSGSRRQALLRAVGGEAVALRLATPSGRKFDPSRFSVQSCTATVAEAGVLPRRAP